MNSIKKILLLLFLGITIGACEDMFEPDRDNSYTHERAVKDFGFANGILDRAYVLLPNEYTMEDVATDDAVSNVRDLNYLRMATGEWSSYYNPQNVWNTSYDAIFNLNYMLQVVDENEWATHEPRYKELWIQRLRGESLGMRGYWHLNLLIHHAGVASDGSLLGIPLVTKVLTTDDNWRLPRDTYQQSVSQINADFDAALGLLPYDWENIPDDGEWNRVMGDQFFNRISGRSVKALQARLNLHAASPAFNDGNYHQALSERAATLAGELIAEIGGIGGMDPNGHRFYINDASATAPEILWRNNHGNRNSRERRSFPPSRFGDGNINPTQNLVDAFPMANGYPITDPASGYDPEDPYTGRDPRLGHYIIYDGNRLNTTVIRTNVESEVDGLDRSTTSTRTGYYLLKLLRPTVNLAPNVNSNARSFYTHVRYTEVFLIYAEAANQAWGPDADPNNYGFTARDVIAALRARAGIDINDPYLASLATTGELAQLIRTERRLELSFENFRFWDLRRWQEEITEPARGMRISEDTFTPIHVENRNYLPYMYYGPIPNFEILKYNELLQNQGW